MSWTLFAQVIFLIILVYLCLRALINRYYEEMVMAEVAVANKIRNDEILRKELGLVPYDEQD